MFNCIQDALNSLNKLDPLEALQTAHKWRDDQFRGVSDWCEEARGRAFKIHFPKLNKRLKEAEAALKIYTDEDLSWEIGPVKARQYFEKYKDETKT